MKLNQIAANIDIVASFVHTINVNCKMPKITESNRREFSLDIKCAPPINDDEGKIGRLLMQIIISVFQENTELEPDTFEFVIEGVFSSHENISDDEFMDLLNINGGAALYSIARAKIETVSGLTYADGKILLPMVNIIQYFQERSESEG